MKASRVALLAFAGMILTSVSVYSLTPPGGFKGSPERPTDDTIGAIAENVDVPSQTEIASFSAGSTVMVEGRMGHAKMFRSGKGETFVLLEVRGADDAKARTAAPANLAIVMDRSGSMKGSRLINAKNAARAAVDRLNDGDMVTVVAFDTRTSIIVPPTVVSSSSRSRVLADIDGLTLGGDTCISCGIEEAMAQLDQVVSGRVNRMVLLSDGDANNGVRDVPGFRAIAQRCRDRGMSITTIGVDVDYNEKILSAIAIESNGRHYFVENDAGLARVFEQEAEQLTATIASGAEASIELAPGVELDRVFDRSFRRSGNRVLVPLGTFSSREVKTVLMKVRVPAGTEGVTQVASVDLTYQDRVTGKDGRCSGNLGVEIVGDLAQASELDGVVAGRVQRSETAATLKEANLLFEQGRIDEARRKILTREQALRDEATKAKRAAPKPRALDVDRDFENQIAAISKADQGFNQPFATPPAAPVAGGIAQAAPPPAAAPQQSRAGKGAVRLNEKNAADMGF